MGITLGFQRSEGTRSRPRRGRSQGFGDMSPTSILEGFSATGNPLKYAILRKIALLASSFRNLVKLYGYGNVHKKHIDIVRSNAYNVY